MIACKRSAAIAATLLLATLLSAAGQNAQAADAGSDAKSRVSDAVQTVDRMKQDRQLAQALADAKGVFVIPHYGRGALIVGGQGGGGVVLAQRDGKWTDPVFYDIGGASVGAQAGGEEGSVAFLLTTRKALDKFADSQNTWTLNANAGLTVAKWSNKGQVGTGNGDVIVWTNTNGLYGGLTASVTDVTPNKDLIRAYYGRQITPRQILSGNVSPSDPNAAPLREALATRVASK